MKELQKGGMRVGLGIRLIPFLPVMVAPLILFIVPLCTGKVLFWGVASLQFIPWRVYAAQALKEGYLPLWNHLNGMGAPLIANYQLAFFYPPNWPLYLVQILAGTGWMAWCQTLLVVLHLVLAGVGMVFFLRGLGLGKLSQTVGGLAFSLSGTLVARGSFFSMIETASWLPWVMYATTRLVQAGPGRRFRSVTVLSVCASMLLLAGHAQWAWYSAVFASLWLLKLVFFSGKAQFKLGVMLSYGAAWTAALGTAAIQLLPTLEYLIESQRSVSVDSTAALTYSFWPWRLITFLSPNFFGNPSLGNYSGYASFWEDAGYFGLFPAFMAFSAFLLFFHHDRTFRNTNRTNSIFFGAAILVGFLLALGNNTPVFPFLFDHVPTFNMFQAPARYLLIVVFCLVTIASINLERLETIQYRDRSCIKRIMVVSAAVTLGAGYVLINIKEVRQSFSQGTAIFGFLSTIIFLLVMIKPQDIYKGSNPVWLWAVIVFTSVDLISAGWGLNPEVGSQIFSKAQTNMISNPHAQEEGREFISLSDEYRLKFQRFFRFSDIRPNLDWLNVLDSGLPNTNLILGEVSANNFDPLLPARFSTWMTYINTLTPEKRLSYLKVMGVNRILEVSGDKQQEVSQVQVEDPKLVNFAVCALNGKDANDSWIKTLAILNGRDGKAGNIVVIETSDILPTGDCSLTPQFAIFSVKRSPNGLEILFETDQPGFLVVRDVWYPGWRAELDGQPVTILKADYLFRAVKAEKGAHRVVIKYQPESFALGWAVSLGTLFIIMMAWGIHWHRNRNRLHLASSDDLRLREK